MNPVSKTQSSTFLAALEGQSKAWVERGVRRQRRILDGPADVRTAIAGQRATTAFLSNDYLGLAADPELREAVAEGARLWGAGAASSPLISGHMRCHANAEEALADFTGHAAALLFITGYMANLAVVSSLLGDPADAVFSDSLNHASLIDGCRLSRARIERYPHGDLATLAERLEAVPARRRLIVTDAVFSMDGDSADLHGLHALAEQYDALLLVDDAHGFGVFGPDGRGSLAAAGIRSERVILMGTLGKAAGLSGAFVAASALIIEHLIQHARSYVFSTAPAPALAYAIPTALDLIVGGEARRAQLRLLRTRLAVLAKDWRYPLATFASPIVPIHIGGAVETMQLAQGFAEQGVLLAGIRPPTVPVGASRLRISLSASHETQDVDTLAQAARTLGFEQEA